MNARKKMLQSGFQTNYDSMICRSHHGQEVPTTPERKEKNKKEIIDLCSSSSSEDDEEDDDDEHEEHFNHDDDSTSNSVALLPKANKALELGNESVDWNHLAPLNVTSSSSSSFTTEEKNKLPPASSGSAPVATSNSFPSSVLTCPSSTVEERFDIISPPPVFINYPNQDAIDSICNVIDREVYQHKLTSTSKIKKPTVLLETKNLVVEYCWSCESDLYPRDGDLICEHPLLRVTACSLCTDKAHIVEEEVQALSSQQEMEICSWCADEDLQDERLFICDNCPRVFCMYCVKKSYGKDNSDEVVNVLMSEDEDEPWFCLFCAPTPFLNTLRELLLDQSGKVSTPQVQKERDACLTKGSDSLEDEEEEDEKIQLLIDKLAILEEEMEEITKRLETPSIEQMRLEISKEIINEEEVDIELDLWKQKNLDRHSNISDSIGIIHDDLESKGIDLSVLYKEFFKYHASLSHEEDPEWKKSADEELNRRDEEEYEIPRGMFKGAYGYEGLNSHYCDMDELSPEHRIVHDLCTADEAIETLQKISERSSKTNKKRFEDAIEIYKKKALKNDDIELEELQINSIQFNDDSDIMKYKYVHRNRIVSRYKCPTHTLSMQPRIQHLQNVVNGFDGDRMKFVERASKSEKYTSKIEQKSNQSTRSKKRKVTPILSSQIQVANQKKDCLHYEDSSCVLGTIGDKHVCVVKSLAEVLKPHQVEGCKFMWKQTFDSELDAQNEDSQYGCILAHNMGLGKSLQVIATVHTILTNPVLKSVVSGESLWKKILLVVPVNVLQNWLNEFNKWTINIPKILIYDFNSSGSVSGRKIIAERWNHDGGVLMVSCATLARVTTNNKYYADSLLSQSDIVILDEAHLMLKNSNSLISKTLSKITTKKRIALTGTPLQNNLMEYYGILNWVRPYANGTQSEFEKKYSKILIDSLASDASVVVQEEGERLLQELTGNISSYVNRLDSSILENDLPPMKQAVLHVRRTKAQSKLYQAFKKYRRNKDGKNNFLDDFAKLSPVNNHPGVLLKTKRTQSLNVKRIHDCAVVSSTVHESQSSCEIIVLNDTDDENDDDICGPAFGPDEDELESSSDIEDDQDQLWWTDVSKTMNLNDIEHGGKMILLLQLLAHAELIGDKVIVFSKCLRTLSFIEDCIQSSEWEISVPCISQLSPGRTWGNWVHGVDYMRLDGSTKSVDRHKLIQKFNSHAQTNHDIKELPSNPKVFLISIMAGSVGTNLVAANRVVLFDSSWNPAVDSQAVFRCYRYGQTKPVYVYRFLTDESMEQKVYSRIVNKTAMAARVIDQKNPQRNFTSSELEDILEIDNWVQCDECEKWRMLPPWSDFSDIGESWECKLNVFDPPRSRCSAKERDQIFYRNYFNRQIAEQHRLVPDSQNCESDIDNITEHKNVDDCELPVAAPEDIEKIENMKKDLILTKLLELPAPGQNSKKFNKGHEDFKPLITKFYYHESLMKEATMVKK